MFQLRKRNSNLPRKKKKKGGRMDDLSFYDGAVHQDRLPFLLEINYGKEIHVVYSQ